MTLATEPAPPPTLTELPDGTQEIIATADDLTAAVQGLRYVAKTLRRRLWDETAMERLRLTPLIRVIVDPALRLEPSAWEILNIVVIELWHAHPQGDRLGVEVVVRHEPSAFAQANLEAPDAPQLWLAGLCEELIVPVRHGVIRLDPPCPRSVLYRDL
ncbi:hypothetical protein E1091_02365 [Micromonospora fluostatini]|uniref:Histidine kinase n=1 Tax=Micromonospora fluostatini TaxID=1629071 RepID=A0ABY2DQZ8_9ACTN|nr:hypothetical protein E1091_02365 [Micromonospora fluostatini]